jgi:hypothetical protein
MSRPTWITRLFVSAIAYFLARSVFDYLAHRRSPSLSELPGILITWLVFAIGYFGWDRYIAGKEKRRKNV